MKNINLSAAPWRLLNGNCGHILGIMSAENKPVAMLGVATALNTDDVNALICVPELVASLDQRINELEMHIELQNHVMRRDNSRNYDLVNQLEANLEGARELRKRVQGETNVTGES